VVSVITLTPGSLGITELVSAAAGSALDVGAGIGVVVALIVRVVGAAAVGLVALVAAASGGTAGSTARRAEARRATDRSLRVLHVASSYPFDEEDPTAPFMAEMLEALAAEGVDVTAIVPDAPGMTGGSRRGVVVVPYRFPFWRRRTWGHGSSQRSSGRVRPAAVIAAPFAMVSMVRSLRREIRRRRPDVVHLHWLFPQGIAALAVPRSIPIVLSVHGAGVRLAVRRPFTRPLARLASGRIDHVIGASRTILDQLAGIVPDVLDRSSIVEHGAGSMFGPGDRAAARRTLDVDEREFLVLAVGRLVPLKGFPDAIAAIGGIEAPARLVLAGDGPARAEIVEAADRLAPGRVTFLGAIGRSDLAAWYTAADCVVIPSIQGEGGTDTGPVVLVEALASGRPVVSTAIGMAPRLVMDGVNGYLVPEGDSEAIEGAFERIRAAADSLDEASRRSFEHHGGWDRVAAVVERRYEIETERFTQPM
jgi:glycosyltransferase involved in cell wall biosynthesis